MNYLVTIPQCLHPRVRMNRCIPTGRCDCPIHMNTKNSFLWHNKYSFNTKFRVLMWLHQDIILTESEKVDRMAWYHMSVTHSMLPPKGRLDKYQITTKHNKGKTVYVMHKKYVHGFCFAVLCCGYILTDFPISTRLTSLALWQSNDCPSASKATLMNIDKYFMWIHYERLHNHNKAKHNKTMCIFLGIYCKMWDKIT